MATVVYPANGAHGRKANGSAVRLASAGDNPGRARAQFSRLSDAAVEDGGRDNRA